MSYRVHLQKFEGPLPLLLYLIRKDEMDIFDINIFEITTQYMEHIRLMKELDLEVAGDFVAMAATLLQIKSRMLLPNYNEDGEVSDTEDPRKELVQMLLEYQKFQAAGKNLIKRYLLGRDVFGRGATYRAEDQMGAVVIEADNALFALIGAYRRTIKKMKSAVHQVKAKTLSIASRIMQIKDRLIVGRRVLLADIVAKDTVNADPKDFRTQLLITFLSILELGRLGFVSLFQSEVFSDIHIEAKTEIASAGLERVQEFDSADNLGLSDKLFQNKKVFVDMTADDLAPENVAAEAAQTSFAMTEPLSIDDLDEENSIFEDGVAAATDEEILNAEIALEPHFQFAPLAEPMPEYQQAGESEVEMNLDATVDVALEANLDETLEMKLEPILTAPITTLEETAEETAEVAPNIASEELIEIGFENKVAPAFGPEYGSEQNI